MILNDCIDMYLGSTPVEHAVMNGTEIAFTDYDAERGTALDLDKLRPRIVEAVVNVINNKAYRVAKRYTNLETLTVRGTVYYPSTSFINNDILKTIYFEDDFLPQDNDDVIRYPSNAFKNCPSVEEMVFTDKQTFLPWIDPSLIGTINTRYIFPEQTICDIFKKVYTEKITIMNWLCIWSGSVGSFTPVDQICYNDSDGKLKRFVISDSMRQLLIDYNGYTEEKADEYISKQKEILKANGIEEEE